ncbi:hypothetical protein BUALT_Bualt16G0062400 [Buddleja alternifolia]|uniref:DNA helicase Pif1-like 2B domain-containing protein n=1 Tax=Buddleja alternifolia TaxID=168488 RepID=A0AAV6WBB0_9LAMI|nr:hypothetical protein BUALT_Bualt16G0062400 [Buddleja alternifolia]
MRAQDGQNFSNFLLNVGNGEEPTIENDMIRIPDSMSMPWEGEHSIDELIHTIFPDLSSHTYDADYMESRAIITPLNDDVNKLNEKALDAFPGEEVTYYSFDSVADDTRNLYLAEFLNSILPGNFPPHKLTLKKGSPIMLLRNIDPKIGELKLWTFWRWVRELSGHVVACGQEMGRRAKVEMECGGGLKGSEVAAEGICRCGELWRRVDGEAR